MERNLSVRGRSVAVYNARGQTVGALEWDAEGRAWLVKTGLDARVHQLRQPPAWATDGAHLLALRRAGGYGVRIVTTTGETWESLLADWDAHAIRLDRGFGEQAALPLKWWTCHREGARQLALFGVAS